MANKFSQDDAPSVEPAQITVGAFVQWKRSNLTDDYPPDEYRLVYSAISASGNQFAVTSSEGSDGNHLFEISSGTSGGFTPGEYYWQIEIERISDGERVLDRRGNVQVLPDFASAGVNPRAHAEVMLDKIESILEGRADKDVASYSIGNRSITKMSIAELLEWRARYRQEVRAIRNQRAIEAGKAPRSTIKAKFV